MNAAAADGRTLALIDELYGLPAETSWVELKESNADPQKAGKLISALSDAADPTGGPGPSAGRLCSVLGISRKF